MYIENLGGMYPHLKVVLNNSPGILCYCFCLFVLIFGVQQKCLGAGSTSSGMVLLPTYVYIPYETEPLLWWEEMTLQEIPYSSRVTKLSGNNEGMSMRRTGMCCRHSLSWPCTCCFLGMKQHSFGP